ncbi:MAG TPA: hypothetical protein VML55_08215 [Planctomycetaceae bacterium]|nr:hypothetical protein [Planctomycetaceae bacterium]
MRRFAVLAGSIVSFALLCGCGAGGRPQTLAWLGRGEDRIARSEPAADNPFRRAAEPQQELVGEPVETASYRADDAAPAATGANAVLDAETQALVDRELQDASPEERRQLLAEFESIEPGMVRQLLRIRRMVRQVGHHPAPDETVAGVAPPQAGSLPGTGPAVSGAAASVGYSLGGPEAEIAFNGEGLGSVNPWSRAAGQNPSGPDARSVAGAGAAQRPVPPAPMARPTGAPSAAGPPGPGVPTTQAPVQLLPAEAEPAPSRSPASALARMVPRLDGFPSLFPGGTGPVPAPAPAPAPPPASEASPGAPWDAAPPLHNPSPGTVWHRDLDDLIARLEANVAQLRPATDPGDPATEDYVEAHVYLRLLYLIAGRQEQALAHLPEVDPAVQQFWQQLLWSMANYFDVENMPDPAERASQTLAQLHAAATHLHEQAQLRLANVAFCTKITSFGNYDRFNPYEFSPGQPVLLYAEVENFRSEPTTDQQGQNAFRTILQSRVEILSPSGDLRFQMEFPPTEDLCRAHRRDYFHSYEFTIPPRIPYGHHVLVLSVEDRLSHKLATYRLNFTVK